MSSIFMQSAFSHLEGGNKKTMVYIEDLPLADKFDEEELNLFLKFGETDLKKVEKTKEEIEKEAHTKINSLDDLDPRCLLQAKK